MRRAAFALALLALVVPPASASEAADCLRAPVPTRAPEASDAAAGLLVTTHAAVALLASERADARINVTGSPVVTLASVEAVFIAKWDGGPVRYRLHYAYDLVGTRSVTCFTWPASAGWSWESVEVWGNATTGNAVALDVWLQ